MAMSFLHRFIALLAVVAGIGVASAATVTTYSVVASTGTLSSDGDNWTASGLEYLAPGSNDGSNRSETGWYAGITRTWALSYTGSILKNYTGAKASDTKASFSDNAGRSIDEFSVRTILGADASPDGSGIKNEFQLGGLTQYMKTTEWNVWVTPEILHGLAQQNEDYVATLNIGGSTYTITVPRTSVLKDGDGVTWYPAVAVVDGKVYGDMTLAVQAAIVAAAGEKDMEFYVEPTGYPQNMSAEKVGDVWKLVLDAPTPIDDAVVTLSATEIIVRDQELEVWLEGVTLGSVPLQPGVDYVVDEASVLKAQGVGEYTVTVTGIGSFNGSASATWKIIAPTGEFAADAFSKKQGDPAYGQIDPTDSRRFEITNSVALVYRNDAYGERWEAAVTVRWPHEETEHEYYILQQVATKVQYTDAKHATVAVSDEEIAYGDEILDGEWDGLSATLGSAKYYVDTGILGTKKSVEYDYFDTLTWTVPIYAEDVQAAIDSGAENLVFSIVCGSYAWGDETVGDVSGIRDTEFTVSLGLEKVFLLDGAGNQVFPQHVHDWQYDRSQDGTELHAHCAADGCFLAETLGELTVKIIAKDSLIEEYAEGHYRDGVPAEAALVGADEFAHTGAQFGSIEYRTLGGALLDSAPIEPGKYAARVTITEADTGSGDPKSWTISTDDLEILAGEAICGGVHARDAATFLERATGDAMEIFVGKSYTATKAYSTPARHGLLNLSCGVKTYDLDGFTVTAAKDLPLFYNAGRLVIRDSSECATGTISANPCSEDDVIIVNTGTLTIESGTFIGTISNEGGTVTITGGRFSVKPDESFVAEQYDLVKRGKFWCVEKHEHKYILTSVGNRILVATCANILADGTLQISHCPNRQFIALLGIRKYGLIPQLSIDYDRKEHPAEFYAINMSAVASILRNDSLLDVAQVLLETDFSNFDETSLLQLLVKLGENASFGGIISDFGKLFYDAESFEEVTGATFGDISYYLGFEKFEGVPVEAGLYTAVLPIETKDGCHLTLKGTYRINEKELPIETPGHSIHTWSFTEDGAKVTATCPGGLLSGFKCNASPMAIELVPSVEGGRKMYDSIPLEVAVSNLQTFVINTEASVSDIVYLDFEGNELESAPVEPGRYTAKVVVEKSGLLLGGTFTASLELVIDERPQICEFPCSGWTKHIGACRHEYCMIDGNVYYEVVLPWPHMIEQLLLTPRFTDPDHAIVSISTAEKPFTGSEILAGAGEELGLSACAGCFVRLKKLCVQSYMTGVRWVVPFTAEEIAAALAAGETEIVRTITIEGKCCEDDLFGLKPATYTIILDLEYFAGEDASKFWIRYLGNGADSGEMEIECRISTVPQRLADSAFKKKGWNFLGWSFDPEAEGLAGIDFADRQFVSDEFKPHVTNDIYAVWTTNVVVSGEIVGDNYESITSVSIWGVGSTEADAASGRVFGKEAPWRYVFEVPQTGAYDVVTVAEGTDGGTTTTTTLVIASNDPETGRKGETVIDEPVGDWSSTVDNSGSGEYPVVVGGIDQIAKNAITPDDLGKPVEIRFTVTEMPANDTTEGYTNIKAAHPAGCIRPLDFTLAKYVAGELVQKLHDLTAYNGIITTVMPFTRGGRRNFVVGRFHDGKVDILPEGVANANADGECFVVDEESNELLVRGAKLSTYALMWDGAIVSCDSLVWNVDWLSGMYVPTVDLSVKEGDGWANTVTNMCFLFEKRDGIQLWDAKANKPVSTIETIDGVEFYKVSLKDRFVENDVAGPDSAQWGAAWFDAKWINAQLSEILLYAPSYWPHNPKDVADIDNLVAYVAYESCDCAGLTEVSSNNLLMNSLSAMTLKSAASPLTVARLNTSLAVGAAVSSESEPYLNITSFSFVDGVVAGTVEVGAGSEKGSLGSNASVVLWGAKSLGEGFEELITVECDSEGNFAACPPEGYSFFKVKLAIGESVK